MLCLSLLLGNGSLLRWERIVQDYSYRFPRPVDTRIVMVTVDDTSLETLGQWPWPRSYHAELINRLSEGKPAVIAFDFLFTENGDPEEDALLVEAAKNRYDSES